MSDERKTRWREERKNHWREKRWQTLTAFFEQQRKEYRFINLMDVADWCACSATTASVAKEKKARNRAYRRLAQSMLRGEFEQGRPHVRFLHPEISRWRLNREQIRIALKPYDTGRKGLIRLADAEDGFWRFCWLPRELARQWLAAHCYPRPAPAHFDPTSRAARPVQNQAAGHPAITRRTKLGAVQSYIASAYPNAIPAGMTDKAIARSFEAEKKTQVSERTVRRARQPSPAKTGQNRP
jgi:hypothetical protein